MKFKAVIYNDFYQNFESFIENIQANKYEIIHDISYCQLAPKEEDVISILINIKYEEVDEPDMRFVGENLLNLLKEFLDKQYCSSLTRVRIYNMIARHMPNYHYSFWDLEADVYENIDFCKIRGCGVKALPVLREFIAHTKIKYGLYAKEQKQK